MTKVNKETKLIYFIQYLTTLSKKKFYLFIIKSHFSEMNLLLAIVLLQATILLCSEGASKAPKGTIKIQFLSYKLIRRGQLMFSYFKLDYDRLHSIVY
jgi:hypothetical protein